METHSNNVEMSYISKSQDLAGLDVSSALLGMPLMSNAAILGSYHRQQLEQWYTTNDGPWIPKDLAPTGGQGSTNARGHGFGYPGLYRESISPSECETAPPGFMLSDSGYGSHGAKQSVATASIYEAPLDHETQSLMGDFSNLMTSAHWIPAHSQPQMSGFHRSMPSDPRELKCDTCQKTLKTNSELK